MKKIISLLLCGLLAGSAVLTGCSGGDVMDNRETKASADKYRNFYEIFTQ